MNHFELGEHRGMGHTQVSQVIKHTGSSGAEPDSPDFDSSEMKQESKYSSAPLNQRSDVPQPQPSGIQLEEQEGSKAGWKQRKHQSQSDAL